MQTLASCISRGFDAYYVGLPFWGLASTVCGYLWFRSGISALVATFGVISSAQFVITAFAYLIFPGFANTVGLWWFDVPMVMFELAIGSWLLFKGLGTSGTAGPDLAQRAPA